MNTAHVHLGLARNSDWAFTSAVVVLVVALLLLAVELAYARSRAGLAARLLPGPAARIVVGPPNVSWSAPDRWPPTARRRASCWMSHVGRSTNASGGPG